MTPARRLAFFIHRLAPKQFSIDALELLSVSVADLDRKNIDRMSALASGGRLERKHVVQALNEGARGEL